jgi:hypothetical protein
VLSFDAPSLLHEEAGSFQIPSVLRDSRSAHSELVRDLRFSLTAYQRVEGEDLANSSEVRFFLAAVPFRAVSSQANAAVLLCHSVGPLSSPERVGLVALTAGSPSGVTGGYSPAEHAAVFSRHLRPAGAVLLPDCEPARRLGLGRLGAAPDSAAAVRAAGSALSRQLPESDEPLDASLALRAEVARQDRLGEHVIPP